MEGDWVFMYTDGYYDQLSGEKMISLGMEKFENILKVCVSNEMDKKEFLLQELNSWRGNCPQIDDLLVMGFKLE